MRVVHPFLIDSIYVSNEKNGTFLLVKEGDLQSLIDQLTKKQAELNARKDKV